MHICVKKNMYAPWLFENLLALKKNPNFNNYEKWELKKNENVFYYYTLLN